MLTWGAPQEPNGEIVRYEVSYTVNSDGPHITNVELSTFTISEVPPVAVVSNITITAYTNVGPGEATILPDVVFFGEFLTIKFLPQ